MVSLTFSLDNKIFNFIKLTSWVNWSEVAREKLNKKDVFEKYIKTGKLSDKDWKFCEKIDWHPVDELSLKEEFIKELEQRKKGPFIKLNSVEEIFEE